MKLIGQINPNLTPSHKIAIEASIQKKIKDTNKEDLTDPIITLLGEACELIGQKANGLTATAKLLRDELKNYFSTYSVEEVRIAVRMGVTEKLIPHDGLSLPLISVVNICKFIHAYNDKVRKEAIHEQRRFEEKNQQEEIKRKEIEGNKWLDSEIELCKENYKANNETLEHVPEALRACYFRRIQERSTEKALEAEIKRQIMAIAESRHDTFEELEKLEQKAMQREKTVEKFEIERKAQVKLTAESIALKYLFDKI